MDTIELADSIIEAIYKKVHEDAVIGVVASGNKTLIDIAEICLKEVSSKDNSEFKGARIKKKEWKSAIPILVELLEE